uniref:Calponin-homology (CH) domain-containing protein n=1 Tax=Amphiprion percula TaxID=161767 RepID=A0A3P8TZ14_AMPPE
MAKNVIIRGQPYNHNELLAWLNETLETSFTKVEQLSTGAAYCQLMDWLFPGSLDFSSVQFQSDDIELASVHNLSLLKTAFSKIGVNKVSITAELIQVWGFTVSLDFLQWFKLFFDRNNKGREYHALEARGGQSLVCAVPGMYQCTTSHRSSTHILHMDTATPAALNMSRSSRLTPAIRKKQNKKDHLFLFNKSSSHFIVPHYDIYLFQPY